MAYDERTIADPRSTGTHGHRTINDGTERGRQLNAAANPSVSLASD